MIREVLRSESDDRWADILPYSLEEMEPKISRMLEDEKTRFRYLYKEAKKEWKCDYCPDFTTEKMRSGYVECIGKIHFKFSFNEGGQRPRICVNCFLSFLKATHHQRKLRQTKS